MRQSDQVQTRYANPMKRRLLKFSLLVLGGAAINFVIACYCFRALPPKGCGLPPPTDVLETLAFPAETQLAPDSDVWSWIHSLNVANSPPPQLYLADTEKCRGARVET